MKKEQPQPPFQQEEFIEKWDEWLQYRKERKLAKYVPTGLAKTWSNLLKMSRGDPKMACAIIDQSISQNWQGLFELKQNGINRTNTQPNAHAGSGTSSARIEALKNLGRREAS